MQKRVLFRSRWLPFALLTPQIVITLIFFIWPAAQALYQSFLLEDAFGLGSEFVWFDNFADLFDNAEYPQAFLNSFVFAGGVTFLGLSISLILASLADNVIKGAGTYKALLTWPYAIAPVVAGVLWLFMFSPTNGVLTLFLRALGLDWNHALNGDQAMILVIVAATYRQIAYNFLFFLAGLQAIPKSLNEAAAIDGAGPMRRFFTVTLPLLSPTTFFLLVVNMVYGFFEAFPVIHAITEGGPGASTQILVYKVFKDGFVGLDLGGSAAQSVILMLMVVGMTVIQFRYIERRVEY